MAAELEVEHVRDLDVDDAEEALVLSLEFTLVEDLNGDDGAFLDLAGSGGREEEGIGSVQARRVRINRVLEHQAKDPFDREVWPASNQTTGST